MSTFIGHNQFKLKTGHKSFIIGMSRVLKGERKAIRLKIHSTQFIRPKYHRTYAKSKRPPSSIASTLGRDISGLRRVIQRNSSQWTKANKGSYLNDCALPDSCRKRYGCNLCTFKGRPCRGCTSCNSNCMDFQMFLCPKLTKAPYVCNGCTTRTICIGSKRIYISPVAQEASDSLRRSSREGHGYTQNELQRL